MKYKPDESTLISYLYGELDETQNQKIQRYFLENPNELKEMHQLSDVLGIIGRVKDKEVIAPPIFVDEETKIRPFWSGSSFRTVLGIAASFLLILVAARLMGTEINYRQGELRITFGGSSTPPVVEKPVVYAGLTEAQVQALINSSLAKNNEATETRIADSQRKLDQTIRQNLNANSKRVDDLVREASLASQDQVRTFVAGLQTENLQLMKNYLQLSTADQQKYVETLLVDFSKYLQEQRNQDLQIFQTRFSRIEQNTDLFKQETEQILASIISNSGTGTKQSNY